MLVLKKAYFLAILLSVVVFIKCGDSDTSDEEEKDPWDKSTDKYRHHLGSSSGPKDAEEPVRVDVTEVSESEVHSSRSKLCKNCKSKIATDAPKIANKTKNVQKPAPPVLALKKEIDEETKEQIKDAIDEQDPIESEAKTTRSNTKKDKQGLSKKQLNHKIDFYPGSLWEYPYPYFHPQYGCGGKKGPCKPEAAPATEAKEDMTKKSKTEKDPLDKKDQSKKKAKKEKVSGSDYPKIKGFGWVWKGPKVSEVGTSWGTPCWFNQKKKQFTCRQLVPTHYYGPPSAGWGGFQPGHTGGGWGTPYWYRKCLVPQKSCRQLISTNYPAPPSAGWGWGGSQPGQNDGSWGAPHWDRKCLVPQKNCRQIIPVHYYGPPSAGWGGFHPGHTGGGWGTPYWYKKCEVPGKNCRQLVPTHYYGPPSAGWGGFQPGHTGGGWGTPYWYKKCNTPQVNCRGFIPSPFNSYQRFMYTPRLSMWDSPLFRYRGLGARKHEVPLRYERPSPKYYAQPSSYSRYNIAALHEWISYLERQRDKDRELERLRLRIKDRDNERRYNLEMLNVKNKSHRMTTRSSDEEESAPTTVNYVVRPHARLRGADSPAIEYLYDNHQGAIYND